MIRLFFAVFLIFGLTACNKSAYDISKEYNAGVVYVENVGKEGIGTGFFISENLILTNEHVIDTPEGKKESLFVYGYQTSHKYAVRVKSRDLISDLAILELLDWKLFKEKEKPKILHLAKSEDEYPKGSRVFVVGHPWGLVWSISEGIVSFSGRRPEPNPKFVLQIDAKIYQGNSGGPVFNEKGNVVCVSELMLEGKGGSYGFCLPAVLVRKVVGDLLEFNEVRWRTLFISVSQTEDGFDTKISDVEAGKASDIAGLKKDDIIKKIYTSQYPNGLTTEGAKNILNAFASVPGNEEDITLDIERKGVPMRIVVKTGYKTTKDFPPPKKRE